MAINLWRYVLYLTICKLRRMSRLARFGACVPGFFVGLVLLVILVSCVVFLCSLSSFPVLYFCVLCLRSLCCIFVFFGFVPCVVFLCSLASFPVLYFCVLWLRSLSFDQYCHLYSRFFHSCTI